jgi:phospholipid/cholesterol/gamma-HCH transport system substrate-binding protein
MRRAAPIALALATAAAAVLILSSGPSRYTVRAEFSDVRGLVSGAQVRLAGVPVGQVGQIWLGRDGWPRAELSIDSDVRLRADARAAVRLSSLSAEWGDYVSVIQGDGLPLAAGATIPRSRTTSPVQIDQALTAFDPATRAGLKRILAGLSASLRGQGAALAASLRDGRTALGEVAQLAGDIGGDGASLQLAVHSTRVIASTLAARRAQLAGAMDRTARLLRTVAARASALRASLVALPAGLSAAQATLTHTRALVSPAVKLLDQASPALAELPAASRELSSAMSASGPTLTRAAQITAQAPVAARAFEPVLRAAGPLLTTMIPVLHRLGPMLDQLRVRLPDAFSFFANWADFTSNYDANGHGARVGIVVPPAPTSVLSPSSNGAGQLAPPYLRIPGSLEGQPWTDYFKSFVAGGKPAADVFRGGP